LDGLDFVHENAGKTALCRKDPLPTRDDIIK
jgi:hypothetical protein